MKLDAVLLQRAESKCELCKSETNFNLYEVQPDDSSTADNSYIICTNCMAQLDKKAVLDSKRWTCLKHLPMHSNYFNLKRLLFYFFNTIHWRKKQRLQMSKIKSTVILFYSFSKFEG